ncbi:MAG: hypothetical protein NW224_02155 [Leptolyngbyaceae cyanobacterium bins.302]|nr:hypothetical protein [Leptolyngbyaceae cyanobacterium bins.302]
MKLTSLMTGVAMVGLVTAGSGVLNVIPSSVDQAVAAQIKQSRSATQDKIVAIGKIKGKPGSADLMRKGFKDLQPIGIQPGGAGMVVNLYSKNEDTTLSLCTMFDVVVAVKKGRIEKFPPNEVK